MNEVIVFAPHLDDELIGCYSIWNTITKVVYWTEDYRIENIKFYKDHPEIDLYMPDYIYYKDFDFKSIKGYDTILLPSKFDFHPLHKEVRNFGLGFDCKKFFYSIEMNVPWLEEEADSKGKFALLRKLYPSENLIVQNEKYHLFCSIKDFDEIIWGKIHHKFEAIHKYESAPDEVSFLRYPHRHMFHLNVWIQQMHTERDKEYFLFKDEVIELMKTIPWDETTSCERYAIKLSQKIQNLYPDRLVKVELTEDGENGAVIE